MQAIRRRWDIDLGRLSYGGLKDRHAHTIQYLTILRGPRRRLTHHEVELDYLGQVETPYASQHIRANRFHLTLRDMTDEALGRAIESLAEVERDGVPNYFDDQRFGSVAPGETPSFVARFLVEGRFEEALRQALAAPYEHDRGEAKREKAILPRMLGRLADVQGAAAARARPQPRRLPRASPDGLQGRCARLRPDLRGTLSLRFPEPPLESAARPLAGAAPPARSRCCASPFVWATWRCTRQLDDGQRAELAALTLPLPTARLHLDAADPKLALVQEVLAEEGLELGQLKVKGVREMFFSKGDRPRSASRAPSSRSRPR